MKHRPPLSGVAAAVLSLTLLAALSACGSGASAQQPGGSGASSSTVAAATPAPTPPPAPTPTPAPSYEGNYTMFAYDFLGFTLDSSEAGISAVITLDGNGGGTMVLDSEASDIHDWKVEDGSITFTSNDQTVTGTLSDGIMSLEVTEGFTLYLAAEGADTSSIEVLSQEEARELLNGMQTAPESLLYAFCQRIDNSDGLHLNYEQRIASMGAVNHFDVHYKDGMYYSDRRVEIDGVSSETATLYRDGRVYTLWPESMTGTTATETDSALIAANAVLMDNLYSMISYKARETDYTTETRDLDGTSCQVEIFPATAYQAEQEFYFDGQGNLIFCREAAREDAELNLGEITYTVHAIDGAVDSTLFELAGYQLAE